MKSVVIYMSMMNRNFLFASTNMQFYVLEEINANLSMRRMTDSSVPTTAEVFVDCAGNQIDQ